MSHVKKLNFSLSGEFLQGVFMIIFLLRARVHEKKDVKLWQGEWATDSCFDYFPWKNKKSNTDIFMLMYSAFVNEK